MKVYIILLVICIISLKLYTYCKNKIFKIFPYIAMSFVCGFRGENVGIDTINYNIMYEYIKIGLEVKAEYGYYFLVKIVQTIGASQQLVFLIMSSLTSIFIYKYIDYESDNFEISTLIYLCIGPYYFTSYNTIREALAVAIFLFSIRYIRKSRIKYIFWILVASLFHQSVILFLGILIFDKIISKFSYLKTMIFTTVLGLLFLNTGIIDFIIKNYLPQYKNYINGHYQTMDISYLFFAFISVVIIFIASIKKTKFKSKHTELLILAFIFIILPIITDKFTMIFTRLASYVTPILIIITPKLRNIIKQKKIYNICLLIFCFSYFIFLISKNINMNRYVFNFNLIK